MEAATLRSYGRLAMALQVSRDGEVAMARATKHVKSAKSQLIEGLGPQAAAAVMRLMADALYAAERLEWPDRRLVMEHAAKQISIASYDEEENRAALAEAVADAPF